MNTRRVFLVIGFIVLLGVAFGVGLSLMLKQDAQFGVIPSNKDELVLVKKLDIPFNLGEVILKTQSMVTAELPAEKAVEVDERNTQEMELTDFAPFNQQKIDASIMSRGYGEDGIERVQIRGVLKDLFSIKMIVEVEDLEYQVYLPEKIGKMCIPETITGKGGKTFETRKAHLDLTTYNSTMVDGGRDEIGEYVSVGDDVLVLVGYQDGDMVAIAVAGYGCAL